MRVERNVESRRLKENEHGVSDWRESRKRLNMHIQYNTIQYFIVIIYIYYLILLEFNLKKIIIYN